MILDAGVLISIDRGEQSARTLVNSSSRNAEQLHTTAPVAAQVWRNGTTQVHLTRALRAITVHPFRAEDVPSVGEALRRSGTSDVVDAHLMILAIRIGHHILTADTDDLTTLANHLPNAPTRVLPWP